MISINTSIRPEFVQLRLYQRLGPNNVPEGEYTLFECQVEKKQVDGCVLTKAKTQGRNIWEIHFLTPDKDGVWYMAVSSVWPVPPSMVEKVEQVVLFGTRRGFFF